MQSPFRTSIRTYRTAYRTRLVRKRKDADDSKSPESSFRTYLPSNHIKKYIGGRSPISRGPGRKKPGYRPRLPVLPAKRITSRARKSRSLQLSRSAMRRIFRKRMHYRSWVAFAKIWSERRKMFKAQSIGESLGSQPPYLTKIIRPSPPPLPSKTYRTKIIRPSLDRIEEDLLLSRYKIDSKARTEELEQKLWELENRFNAIRNPCKNERILATQSRGARWDDVLAFALKLAKTEDSLAQALSQTRNESQAQTSSMQTPRFEGSEDLADIVRKLIKAKRKARVEEDGSNMQPRLEEDTTDAGGKETTTRRNFDTMMLRFTASGPPVLIPTEELIRRYDAWVANQSISETPISIRTPFLSSESPPSLPTGELFQRYRVILHIRHLVLKLKELNRRLKCLNPEALTVEEPQQRTKAKLRMAVLKVARRLAYAEGAQTVDPQGLYHLQSGRNQKRDVMPRQRRISLASVSPLALADYAKKNLRATRSEVYRPTVGSRARIISRVEDTEGNGISRPVTINMEQLPKSRRIDVQADGIEKIETSPVTKSLQTLKPKLKRLQVRGMQVVSPLVEEPGAKTRADIPSDDIGAGDKNSWSLQVGGPAKVAGQVGIEETRSAKITVPLTARFDRALAEGAKLIGTTLKLKLPKARFDPPSKESVGSIQLRLTGVSKRAERRAGLRAKQRAEKEEDTRLKGQSGSELSEEQKPFPGAKRVPLHWLSPDADSNANTETSNTAERNWKKLAAEQELREKTLALEQEQVKSEQQVLQSTTVRSDSNVAAPGALKKSPSVQIRYHVHTAALPFTPSNSFEIRNTKRATPTSTLQSPRLVLGGPRLQPLALAPRTKRYSTLRPKPEADQPRDTKQEPAFSESVTPSHLPHLTPSGSAHMVSITAKSATARTAIAVGRVRFSNPAPLPLIKSNALKKGDVLGVARVAGIMASKKCPEIIPLCHPILLSHVGVELALVDSGDEGTDHGAVEIEAKVQCTGATGVEMEALTAVMGAALTVVDMCKAVDKGMVVEGVTVVLKEGGRSGTWRKDGWVSRFDQLEI